MRLYEKSHFRTSNFFISFNVQSSFMLDEKGSFYIMDAMLAIVLLMAVFLVVNAAISMQNSDYSFESKDITAAQDVMEILSGKVSFRDLTFLGKISRILEENKNSKESIREVSQICKDKFNAFDIQNYQFSENNVLDGKVLASSGDYKKSENVSVATRTYGEYSYTLSIW